MSEKGFVSYLLIALIVMMAGIVVGSQIVQNGLNLSSKAKDNPTSLDESTTDCENNRAVVHLRMTMPQEISSYKLNKNSVTQGKSAVISYEKHVLSPNYEYESGKYAYDDIEVTPSTDYTYYLSINGEEVSKFEIKTPDCSSQKSSCNGSFCLMLKETGCNRSTPFYYFQWTRSKDPQFNHYQMMRNNIEFGGPITPVDRVTLEDSTDDDAVHDYYVVMKKNDGTQIKSGTLSLTNKCF